MTTCFDVTGVCSILSGTLKRWALPVRIATWLDWEVCLLGWTDDTVSTLGNPHICRLGLTVAYISLIATVAWRCYAKRL